ncbi:hypothetical protein [Catellatospora tritici]|uniref:hypothetical protein n=1 Tax=Catellatospora tritici TaxID=2851566 RepID=UPI001C2D2749|nr:hypothetical protein [Catellatospora tritici]MBV1856504.1 hypothetical protein [Catellatospora tritici]
MLGITRDYAAFDCLFGVRSTGSWLPVAAARGLPDTPSEQFRSELSAWGDAAFGVTWISWPEVEAIDWDEPALRRATDVAEYRRVGDALVLVREDVWSRKFGRAAGVDTLEVDPDRVADLWDEGTEWHVGDTVFRVRRARRRDLVPSDGIWHSVWTVMQVLAGVHGEENVRLVAWFEE